MEFLKTKSNHNECYISGRYKIVNYSGWRAYFKPHDWAMWGQACEKKHTESRKYKTVKAAEAGCRRHLKAFGEKPGMQDTLHCS